MEHDAVAKQLIVFQREMPDFSLPVKSKDAKLEEESPEMMTGAGFPDRNGANLGPLLNERETLTEAELAFKEICSDLEDDRSSPQYNESENLSPERFDFSQGDSFMKKNGEVDFFWDGRYHQTSYIRQRDIFDDGEPPPPRAGWPIQQLNLRCIVKDLTHPPLPRTSQQMVYFSLELHLGDQVYKSPVCAGDPAKGYVRFDQLFCTHIDDDVLEAVSASYHDGSKAPVLTAVLYDCSRRFKNTVAGHVTVSVSDLLEIHQEGWHSLVCKLVDNDGKDVLGADGEPSTLALAFDVDERCKIQWTPPTLEQTLDVCEGPLKLQPPGRRRQENMSRSIVTGRRSTDMVKNSNSRDTHEREAFALSEAIDAQNDEFRDDAELDLMEGDDEKQEEIFYWREWLEGWVDGILVQLFIIALVLLDLILLLIYTFVNTDDSSEDGTVNNNVQVSSVATIVILGCFVFELTLRHVAKGWRFLRDKWCIFDFVVIWLSVLMVLIRQGLYATQGNSDNESNLQTANSSTNALRILSRVAQGLRVLRVLVNLRHARALSGKVQGKLRGLVSQNRRRFTKYGFDLDVTYITNRVVAMSAPVFGRHSSYRNDIHVVSRFLAYMHYGNFFVVNLCDTYYSSDRLIGQYHPGMLFNQVQRIPVEDHCPPLLLEVVRFCEDVALWMRRDARNVVAVHCKGGKGRTGVFVSAFLLWSGHRRTALDALELFTFRRTEDYKPELGLDSSLSHGVAFKQSNQTVEGPSQIRYVHYVEAVLYSGINPAAMPKIALQGVSFKIGPRLRKHPMFLSMSISCFRAPVLDSRNVGNTSGLIALGTSPPDQGDVVHIPFNCAVWGDVRLDFYVHDKPNQIHGNRKLAFSVAFHTVFYAGRGLKTLRFGKRKLDILCKDYKDKKTDGDFAVELQLSEDPKVLDLLHYEERFSELCKRIGKRVTFQPGESIVQLVKKQDYLLLIESGTAEGVVDERHSGGPHHSHQLGRCIEAAGDTSGVSERAPFVCTMGPGAVVAPGLFLAHMDTMKYRARTQVTAYRVDRVVRAKKPSLWRTVRLVVNMAKESDHVVDGLSEAELADFYRGLSVKIATQLSRVQAEAIRIGSLRAFSDRQTVMIEVDEGERVRAECIRRFALPMNERLILKAKCHYVRGNVVTGEDLAMGSASRVTSSMSSVTNAAMSSGGGGHKNSFSIANAATAATQKTEAWGRRGSIMNLGLFRRDSHEQKEPQVGPNGVPVGAVNMRLILLANYLVIDPAFYGPTVSTSSVCFPVGQLASVTPPDARSIEPRTLMLSTFSREPSDRGRQSRTGDSWSTRFEAQGHKITFDSMARARQVYTALSSMCQEGEKVRDRDAVPFLDALASCDIARFGTEHKLRSGQRLPTASNVDSLFAIRSGQVKVIARSNGKVFQVVREGQVRAALQ
mmetsp:Transcript_29313/g.77001  ORF Transcript_29313/g.77001 Transcript_29313/m.77001 type:complete len:1413 (+) Transcript_29313:40-4278(+)